jgi:transcriptional regulator with XRE-family HTH domain
MQRTRKLDPRKTAQRLQAAFRRSSYTQAKLARLSGLNQSQISRLLRGNFKRKSRGLYALCKFLNVRLESAFIPASLSRYPKLAECLSSLLDGTELKERAIVKLLESAKLLAAS